MAIPTVTAVTPNFGSLNGGTALTITGTDFTEAADVTIGGVAATALVVVSDTTIKVTAPAGAAGVASIIVTNGDGSNGANSLFFYTGAGVPTDTYIYLKGGRGDGFVPLWTGIYSEEISEEQSEPYRNTFQASTNLLYGGSGGTVGTVPTGTVVTFTNPVVTPPVGGVYPTNMSITGTLSAHTPDEIEGVAPRQFGRKATWRCYLSANGNTYAYRKDMVLGWGSQPRSE